MIIRAKNVIIKTDLPIKAGKYKWKITKPKKYKLKANQTLAKLLKKIWKKIKITMS